MLKARRTDGLLDKLLSDRSYFAKCKTFIGTQNMEQLILRLLHGVCVCVCREQDMLEAMGRSVKDGEFNVCLSSLSSELISVILLSHRVAVISPGQVAYMTGALSGKPKCLRLDPQSVLMQEATD